MPKPRLLVYSHLNTDCSYHESIFNGRFITESVSTKKQFFEKAGSFLPDVAVVCLCFAQKEDAAELALLDALSGPLPLLVCCKNLPLDFVSSTAQLGIERFICCGWNKEKIEEIILETICSGGIKEYVLKNFSGSLEYSPYINKIITEIIHSFPNRFNEEYIAKKLGISVSWLQKLFKRAFAISFNHFIRHIWVRQALYLMKHSNMDNSDIAFYMHYSEESSMARDFRKELGINPTEARQKLTRLNPQDILQPIS